MYQLSDSAAQGDHVSPTALCALEKVVNATESTHFSISQVHKLTYTIVLIRKKYVLS